MDAETPNPYAGSWEGPWQGGNAYWMWPVGGRALLRIAPDGALPAQITGGPGGGLSEWYGEMLVTGEISLEEVPVGVAFGIAHGHGKLIPTGLLHVKLLIGGLAVVPFDAELALVRLPGWPGSV